MKILNSANSGHFSDSGNLLSIYSDESGSSGVLENLWILKKESG